jgi:hypothetical protein
MEFLKMADLKQQLAQQQDAVARLKEKIKKQDTAQKIIIGGLVMSIARENEKIAEWLVKEINNRVTRETDLKRVQPIIDELKKVSE